VTARTPVLAALAVLLVSGSRAVGAAAHAPADPPAGRPDVIVDLASKEGAALVGASWRYRDVTLVNVAARAAGPDLRPSGAPIRALDVSPSATDVFAREAGFERIAPDALEQRRGNGKVSFGWYRVDVTLPERIGSVPVRYEPPAGLSPAAVRYVRTSGSDGRTLAAVIAQLAARECLQIELENGEYKLTQLKANSSTEKTLAPEESRLLELLFEDGPETIIHPSNARNLNIYLLGISGQLQKRLDGMYFTRNIGNVAVGYLASLVFAMGMALTASGRDTTGIIFLTWWFFFCASIVGAIVLTNVIPAAVRAIRGLGGARQLIPGVAVLAAFGSVFVFLLKMLAKDVSPTYSLVLAALVGANLAWAPALKRLTTPGRQAMRDIEGFHLFLEKVEQDQMQRLNAKGEPLGAAIEFVPYAIALEVKEAWGDHLTAECFAAPTTR